MVGVSVKGQKYRKYGMLLSLLLFSSLIVGGCEMDQTAKGRSAGDAVSNTTQSTPTPSTLDDLGTDISSDSDLETSGGADSDSSFDEGSALGSDSETTVAATSSSTGSSANNAGGFNGVSGESYSGAGSSGNNQSGTASSGSNTKIAVTKSSGKSQKTNTTVKNSGSGLALTVLAALPVKGRAPKTGYSRDQFGAAWADVDRNGCDTRNDILARDLSAKTFKDGTKKCVVLTGVLVDPYTAATIKFQRGQNTSSAVQIDHVVALSDAWQKGAQKLSAAQRKQFANDPYNLLAVDGPSNQKKSDGDAATWLPKNKSFRCQYVARQIGVKHKYSLWVTQAEKDAMKKVLAACPNEKIPSGGGAKVTPSGASVKTTTKPATTTKPVITTKSVTTTVPKKTTVKVTTKAVPTANVSYANCAAVRAAGKAPLRKGQPGYSKKLDRDGDGVACE